MNNLASVAILAGGKGTRLASISKGLPKTMVKIAGIPMLEHQLKLCKKHDFTEIALLVREGHEIINDYFGDGSSFGVNLKYVIDSHPKGTGGALIGAANILKNDFLVIYGDTYLDVDLSNFFKTYLASKSNACLFVHPNDHPNDSDIVVTDDIGYVRTIHGYPHPKNLFAPNLVNAALCAINKKSFLEVTEKGKKCDLVKEIFPQFLKKNKILYTYKSPEYIKDAGTPKRLEAVNCDLKAGIPEMLSARVKRKAIFLDRDGTLNIDTGHINSPDQLKLYKDVPDAIRLINKSGYLSLLATNQPVVARGDVTLSDLKKIHTKLESLIGKDGAYLDEIYFCPHHPDSGFLGENKKFKLMCECRKPGIGMFKLASSELNIDLRNSWMIGDTSIDIEAGNRADMKTILLQRKDSKEDTKFSTKPDFYFTSLIKAVRWITKDYHSLKTRLSNLANQLSSSRILLIGGPSCAGKSTYAQIIKDLSLEYGRPAHIICLDSWLHNRLIRDNASDLLGRYDIKKAEEDILKLIVTTNEIKFKEFQYQRKKRTHSKIPLIHKIAPKDLVIVEGCPALFMYNLCAHDLSKTLFIDEDISILKKRFFNQNAARSLNEKKIKELFENRYLDEISLIKTMKDKADFNLNNTKN